MYRVAARLKDPQAQAVAERYASFGHSNLEEYWTLLWRDPSLKPAPMTTLPLVAPLRGLRRRLHAHVVGHATRPRSRSRPARPRAIASRRSCRSCPSGGSTAATRIPTPAASSSGRNGRYLTGDTGYAGLPSARNHNTMTFGGVGQGVESQHDVWRQMDYRALDGIRIRDANLTGGTMRIVADLAAAYPPSAGVTTFTRGFEWNGESSITVTDTVTLAKPLPAEWHLQSDTAFTGRARVRQWPRRRTVASRLVRVAGAGHGHDRPRQRQGPWPARVDREGRRRTTRIRAHRDHAAGEHRALRGQARLGGLAKRPLIVPRLAPAG